MKFASTYRSLISTSRRRRHWDVRKGIIFRALNSFASTAIIALLVLLFLGIPKTYLYEQMKREGHTRTSAWDFTEKSETILIVSSGPQVDAEPAFMSVVNNNTGNTNILGSEYKTSQRNPGAPSSKKYQDPWWLSRAHQISIPSYWNPSIPIAQRRLII